MDRYATLRHGLIGAWCPSLRTGGYTLEGRSSRRYNGTLVNGPGWSQGALSLTRASSHYVQLWDAATTTALSASALAVTAWIQPTVVNTAQAIVGGLSSGGSNGTFQLEVGRTSGRITWLQNGSQVDATSASSVSAGQWSFVGGYRWYDGSTWQIRLIINGVIESFSSANNPQTNNISTRSTAIGRAGEYNGLYFGGLIDDVRIWNRPLTESEVGLLRTGRGVGLLPTRRRRSSVLGSQFYIRDSGAWKTATPWIKVGGVWKQATPKLNVSGTWK